MYKRQINVFMTKLQAIFKAVVTNSARMERVVDDVRQSEMCIRDS